MASVNRRANSRTLAVQEITFETPAPRKKITLKNQGMTMRSDHLRSLRLMSADMILDDYDYSGAEILRCALAQFLRLSLNQQLQVLEHYRKEERRALRGA